MGSAPSPPPPHLTTKNTTHLEQGLLQSSGQILNESNSKILNSGPFWYFQQQLEVRVTSFELAVICTDFRTFRINELALCAGRVRLCRQGQDASK